MKPGDSLLLAALGALASHRELVQEAYERGSLHRTPENARDVFVLHQHRILVTEGHDRYRLATFLKRFLDTVTQRHRLFEYLGEGILALNDRVYKLRDEFHQASIDGRTDDIDNIAGQFDDACAELSDAVAAGISTLLLQAENNFAAVNSLAAKKRQNEHYIAQAEKMGNAIGALSRMSMQDLLDASPIYEALADPYRRLITDRLPDWNAELIRVTAILKAFLFKLRQIEPDVRLIRGFAKFLLQNPGYSTPDVPTGAHLPPWLMRDPGIRPVTYPDVLDDALGPELEAVAQTIKTSPTPYRPVRPPGALVRNSTDARSEIQLLPAYRIALRQMAVAAIKEATPLSAISWLRQHGKALAIPEDIWLLLVLHTQGLRRWPFIKLTYERVERRGPAAISRNVFLSDIRVHGR